MSRPVGVVVGEVGLDLGREVAVVGAGVVEPEDGGGARRPGPGHRELDPVADRGVLGLAGAPDVAGCHVVGHQHRAGAVDDLDATGIRDLEGLVVAAVLLGLLGHQADVRHRAHGRRVEGAVDAAVVDDGLVDAGVRAVGDHREGVVLLAVRAPHVARGADHRGHRRVDDDVARHVEVGDALVGVDHRQARPVGQALLDRGLDLVAVREVGEPVEDAAEAVVGGQAGRVEVGAVALEHLGQEGAHDVAEDDRVADLHHRGLEVDGEEHVVGLGAGDLLAQEGAEGCHAHHRRVDDLALEDTEGVLEHGRRAVGGDVADGEPVVAGEHDGLLVGAEVVGAHGRDVGLAVGAPGSHRVRVAAGVVLHGGGGATIGVALSQNRVDGAALDLVVAHADVALLVGLRVVRVVGEGEALRLQLGDRGLELRHRGRDVGQLDDVGLGGRREVAELGEGVADALVLGEVLGEEGEDAAGQRDVTGLDVDVGRGGEGLHHRQEGVRGQHRGLVGEGVEDRCHGCLVAPRWCRLS